MTENILERLQEVFRAVLELPPDTDVSQLERDGDSRWDSVAHVWLISCIESEFGITIDTAESLEVKSFDQARALLVERGVA